MTKLEINCGCKFKTNHLEEAVKHMHKTGHTLLVLGSITPAYKFDKHPTSGFNPIGEAKVEYS